MYIDSRPLTEEETKSLQTVYDKACKGIIEQGRQSLGPSVKGYSGNLCMYRFQDGERVLKCAIGQLLTDEQIERYKIEEGKNPSSFSAQLMSELIPNVPINMARHFLFELQAAHDGPCFIGFIEQFVERATAVAENYGLVPVTVPNPTT